MCDIFKDFFHHFDKKDSHPPHFFLVDTNTCSKTIVHSLNYGFLEHKKNKGYDIVTIADVIASSFKLVCIHGLVIHRPQYSNT